MPRRTLKISGVKLVHRYNQPTFDTTRYIS